MGTNFYTKIPCKKRELKEKINTLIDNDNLQEAKEVLDNAIEETELHIGKRSYGWKFLFNAHNCKYWDLTKQGIIDYIKKNNGKIVDEYGEEFTLDQFWNEEIDTENGYDAESYEREHPSRYCRYETATEPLKKYNPNQYGEFYNDGLRFTISDYFC